MTVGDSNRARARILGRIRKAQGRGASRPSRAEGEAVERYLKSHPRGPLLDESEELRRALARLLALC